MSAFSIWHWVIIVVILGTIGLGVFAATRSSKSSDGATNIFVASRYHRLLIIAFLLFLVAAFTLRDAPEALAIVLLPIWIVNIVCCYKLALAMGRPPALWATVGAIGFFIVWIPQLLLINAANKGFKAEGLKVGFLGGATRPL